MKVFISWSGARSQAVAQLLSDWVKCVLQATNPWLSTRGIERGALWFNTIHEQLKETTVGIICLTSENRDRPWILFEAGALAKGLSSSRVCTLLIDLKPTDLEDPLAQFNHTLPTHDSMWELIRTLNTCLGAQALDDRILREVFETYWPQFEKRFKPLLSTPTEKPAKPREPNDMLTEILEISRGLQQRVRNLEGITMYNEAVPSGADLPVDPSIYGIINDGISKGVNPQMITDYLISIGTLPEVANRAVKQRLFSRRPRPPKPPPPPSPSSPQPPAAG